MSDILQVPGFVPSHAGIVPPESVTSHPLPVLDGKTAHPQLFTMLEVAETNMSSGKVSVKFTSVTGVRAEFCNKIVRVVSSLG